MNGRTISYEEGERFVRTVYYNLRIYLGQDYFHTRLFAKDKTLRRRRLARGGIARRGLERYFDVDQEIEMRVRRQPTVLFRKDSLAPGALI